MSNPTTYKCGLFVREARLEAGLTPAELGAEIFPYASKLSQQIGIYHIESDKRGVTRKMADEIDRATGSCNLSCMIANGDFELFVNENRLTSRKAKTT